MAETFNSDDEVQQFKAWMAENGLPIVAGLVLGLAIVLGWQGWQAYTEYRAEQAAQRYGQLQQAVQMQNLEAADGLARELREDYRATPYAALGALQLGGAYARKDQIPQADEHLKWVVDYASDDKIRSLARLRRARLLWSRGEPEQALESLEILKAPEAMQPMIAELRGDLLADLGRPAEASEAYRIAMVGYTAPAERALVEQKLDDLAAAASDASAAEEAETEADSEADIEKRDEA